MSLPYEILEMDESTHKKLRADYLGETKGFFQVGPKRYVVPSRYRQLGSEIYNLKVQPDDVWIVAYPRTGAHVTCEMSWLVVKDFDYEGASKTPQYLRFPQIEHFMNISDELMNEVLTSVRGNAENEARARDIEDHFLNLVQHVVDAERPRFVRSHMPYSLLPPALIDTCKTIYLCRNPKDLAVSFYHLQKRLGTYKYQNDFEQFWEYFENDKMRWCPYWEHVREAWEKKDHPNMLFLFFEDIIKDMEGTIYKVAAHYGKQVTEEQVKNLSRHLHIDTFSQNKAVKLETIPFSEFITPQKSSSTERKPSTWDELATPELNARADIWIAKNMARLPGFAFPKK